MKKAQQQVNVTEPSDSSYFTISNLSRLAQSFLIAFLDALSFITIGGLFIYVLALVIRTVIGGAA